jgi:hypothetical protein
MCSLFMMIGWSGRWNQWLITRVVVWSYELHTK